MNVVCWGFHSVERVDLEGLPEFGTGITPANKSTFLHKNQNRELIALNRIVDPICNSRIDLDMVTLVTK